MKPPFHKTLVEDCGYCKDLGVACEFLRARVGVGFWPGLKKGEPDHWYIFWIDREHPTSSAPKEPTEAEIRAAVAAINSSPEGEDYSKNWTDFSFNQDEIGTRLEEPTPDSEVAQDYCPVCGTSIMASYHPPHPK